MSTTPQQSLPESWDQFVEALSQVWDELGLESGIRNTHLEDVLRQVNDVLKERVRQERNVRDLTRRSIQTFASKIVLIYKQMGIDESVAHEFISEHTGPQVTLFYSRDALSRHLDELAADRKLSINELTSVLASVFAMEADLGESTGTLELFCELQSESFDETQANTFRNDPTALDEDTLKCIPQTLERMREKMAKVKLLCSERQSILDAVDESIEALCINIGENKNTYRNSSLLQHPTLSLKRIEAVKVIENQLIALRERRGAILHELANKLRVVWGQLEISVEYREEFCAKNEGRSMDVIRACEEELKRVEVLKQERIHELILLLRDRIRKAWDELSVPTMERKLFEDRYDYVAEATFSDETLDAHKVLANSLEEMVRLSEPLRAKIKEHAALLEEKVKYDELTKNGDRLRDRKYNMREEEKLRKRVARLPSISDTLIVELSRWKATNRNQPLICNGMDYLEFLLDERAKAEEEKAQEKAQRQERRGLVGAGVGISSVASSNALASSSGSTVVATSTHVPAMTPGRPRSVSRSQVPAPATTGKPVAARPRTNTADGTKSIATASSGITRENTLNK